MTDFMGSANSARIIVIKFDCLNFHSEKKKKLSKKKFVIVVSSESLCFSTPCNQDGKIEKISCANSQPYGPIEVGF